MTLEKMLQGLHALAQHAAESPSYQQKPAAGKKK